MGEAHAPTRTVLRGNSTAPDRTERAAAALALDAFTGWGATTKTPCRHLKSW